MVHKTSGLEPVVVIGYIPDIVSGLLTGKVFEVTFNCSVCGEKVDAATTAGHVPDESTK